MTTPVLVILALVAACGIMMVLESRGLPTTLSLHFKGDVKRESRWLAQYGQFVCTVVAAVLVWQLDGRACRSVVPGLGWTFERRGAALVLPIAVATAVTTLVATVLKRLISRVRPGRADAGKFLGPSWTHANYKESFPSSHSANAVALSAMLAIMYPPAAATFWTLALSCAVLRYILDAHWPSDVLGGIALGYAVALATAALFHI